MDNECYERFLLFRGVPKERLAFLTDHLGFVRPVAAGEVLMSPEDPDTDVFFLLEGKVRITLSSHDGRVVSLRDIAPFDYFGWLSAVDSKERLMMAVATETSKVLIVSGERFRCIVLSEPQIFQNFMDRMAGVVRQYAERIQSLSLLSVRQRLVKELEQHASRNQGLIDIESHEDFATWIGTTRETVTRTLRDLEKEGLILKAEGLYQFIDRDD